VAHTVGDLRVGLQLTAYDSPIGENPGAVTAAELARGTDLADSLNIVRRARKAVVHRQVAITAERGRAAGPQLSAVVFAGTRDLDNPQPFAVVGVERVNWGGSLRGTAATAWRGLTLRSSAGVDWQGQRDDRRNWENCNARFGTVPVAACPAREQERGAVRLDQRERLDGLGAFARWELEAPRRATLSAAVRWDELRLLLTDRLITPTNRDDSGDRTLGAVTPMLGLTVRLRPAVSAYANVSTAFETPTLTELTNQADGSAGLNRALEPQRTTMVESGLKALLGAHWRVELAAYAATTRDELVGFDVPGQVGRRAFRNAGRTGRRGVELAVAAVGTHVDGGLALARARYRYDDYVVGQGSSALRLDGREIPGVPGTTASGWVTGRWRGWFVTAEAQAQSRSALDDANSAFAAGWWVANLRLGRLPTVPRLGLEPVVGIDNLFDRRYASTVVVNATRGRFFEPGVQRTWYAGVRVTGGAR
jgi:iron complex outermembrane receptor protein